MAKSKITYPARFDVDYPGDMNRTTTFFRAIWSLPAIFLIALITSGGSESYTNEAGNEVAVGGGGIAFGLSIAISLLIIFRQKYPRWWFDFYLELNRFGSRVGSYLFLLTDRYPSTTDTQSVHLDIDYPNVQKDLSRWAPLYKWLLAIPHYVVLAFLILGVVLSTIVAWFAILFTGRYPKGLFDYVVGVGRWSTRIEAYAFMLTTDKYPPFTLK